MWIEELIFAVFAVMLVGSSIMVIASRNPVRGVLFLVVSFFACAGLWFLLEAEFLALILVLVYVGAVMTLFLFVVMMLDITYLPKKNKFVRYLPFGVIVTGVLVFVILYLLMGQHLSQWIPAPVKHAANYSNVQALGHVLYTQYMYPFELAGVLLLIAIVAAISLAYQGPTNRKGQSIDKQLNIRREDRIRIIKMPKGDHS